MTEKKVGQVFSYYPKAEVAAVRMTDGILRKGDKIHILGHTTDFTQNIDSMQIQAEERDEVRSGEEVGLKVHERVRPNDGVYKIE
ncbi:EF-Tu/IF-2/RF-3 family GTPase [Candidatus Altiarchaeota archaeon]